MSYGDFLPPPPPPPPPAVPWSSTNVPPPEHGNDPGGGGPTPPNVPKVPTGTSTEYLKQFADKVGELLTPLMDAVAALNTIDVRPGAFYHASQIRAKINGTNGGGGLVEQFTQVSSSLKESLVDLQTAVLKMAKKYESTEDLNKLSAADLNGDFSQLSGDLPGLLSGGGSGGGSPPPS